MTDASHESIAARVESVRARIAAAAERSGRSAADITLIAVSKTWPASAVEAAAATGLRDFGENRVQEGVGKAAEVTAPGIQWHLIGHLQTNKVRAALGAFAILHSVDSERLLRAISAVASTPVPLMLEVNVSGEPTKFGIAPAEVGGLLTMAGNLPNLAVRGLMTVAPHVDDVEQTRPVFRALGELARAHGLRDLSMGMTNDYEVAIEEGATHVRVGRAIFGERS